MDFNEEDIFDSESQIVESIEVKADKLKIIEINDAIVISGFPCNIVSLKVKQTKIHWQPDLIIKSISSYLILGL